MHNTFAITDVDIFDGQQLIRSASLLVLEGIIAQVSRNCLDFDGPSFSRPGCTVIPGLIDAHIHATDGSEIALPQALRFGVTTVLDMHNEMRNIEKLHRQMATGGCADLKFCGPAATVRGGWPAYLMTVEDESPMVSRDTVC